MEENGCIFKPIRQTLEPYFLQVNQIALNVILATKNMKVVDLVYLYHMNVTPHIVWVSI